jgi:ATP-binding cassette subfamily C (CFTR/MRP) protein 1
MTDWTVEIFSIMAQGVLLLSAEKLMTGIIPFCMATVFVIQRVYLQTSRQLRFMDLESRSLVYSQFVEAVSYH